VPIYNSSGFSVVSPSAALTATAVTAKPADAAATAATTALAITKRCTRAQLEKLLEGGNAVTGAGPSPCLLRGDPGEQAGCASSPTAGASSMGTDNDNLICNECWVKPACQHDDNPTDFCIESFKLVFAKDSYDFKLLSYRKL
jgi:hypothetical protein